MPIRVLIAASGSGGHLLPAAAVAAALQEKGAIVEFVGSGRPLEEKIIGSAGLKRHVIRTVGLKSRGVKGALEFAYTLPLALWQTQRLLSTFRPQVVVGVGGYVSVLPVLLAAMQSIPTWIHEAELHAGMANGFLSRFVTKVSLAFKDAQLPSMQAAVYTGHPIRSSIAAVQKTFPAQPSNLLIVGGSQGAKSLDAAAALVGRIAAARGFKVRHQVRPENVLVVQKSYREVGCSAEVVSFIDDMAQAYAWADLLLCRAGAGTVMEVEALGIPAIFVPYPHAQADHQTANARTLACKGKALIIKEGDSFLEDLENAINTLFEAAQYQKMLSAPVERRSLQAAKTIAEGVLSLAARV
jgi:UDP-N-acetylglucosamine--N-acetylmuramyl-(pentapeptide) pyrophosphoryl-undecaprenol N-acetylglucosamine transferase